MLDFHGLISLRPQHRAELLFAELCTITAIIVILNVYQPFFLRTIGNTFTVIIHQVCPLPNPKKEERGQTPSLTLKGNLRPGEVKDLLTVPTSVRAKSYGGPHLLCLDAVSKMLEDKALTVSLHFSNLYLFSLSHMDMSGFGNPSQSPPSPLQPRADSISVPQKLSLPSCPFLAPSSIG